MPYEFYKILHISFLFFMISSLTILFLTEGSKKASIVYGISTLLLFVAGFGLLHKTKTSIFTTWVLLKLLIWVILSVAAPIAAKRFKSSKYKLFYLFFSLTILGTFLAIFKPM